MKSLMLMIPKGYEKAALGAISDAKAVAAMMKYNESLQKGDVLLSLDGLYPPSMGARVSFCRGKPRVTDARQLAALRRRLKVLRDRNGMQVSVEVLSTSANYFPAQKSGVSAE